MTKGRASSDLARGDGFTLVELVIVVAIMGLLAAGLSNAIIVILRNNVSVSARLDDNRDLLNLATWVPRDVNSTPLTTVPGTGAEVGNLPSGCASADTGTGLLRLTWTEQIGTAAATTYRVSYRADTSAGKAVVKRYSCQNFGAATVTSASKALDLMSGGALPVAVTLTGKHVVFSVTQHPGTTTQKTVQIEADSKNPALAALPGPPPPPPPPVMSLSASSVNAGLTVTATVSGFAANEVITFFVDTTYSSDTSLGSIGTATASAAGAATAVLTIPLGATNGVHTIFAVGDNNGFAVKNLTINNGTLVLTDSVGGNTALAGGPVTATVSGFAVGDLITFLMDDNTVLGTLTYANGASGKSATITIPAKTTGGLHIVTAKGTSGRRAVSDPAVMVIPNFTLSPTSVPESLATSSVLYGFHAGEAVTYTLDSSSGAVLGSSVADTTGFDKSSLTIPPFTPAGVHNIVATGADTSASTGTVTVTTSIREFTVTTSTPSVTAGGSVTLTLQAMINGVADPTLVGADSITISGVGNSPNNTAPGPLPTTASFTAGVATISVPVVKASPTTFVISDGTRTGSSPPVTVKASTVNSLSFAVTCPSPIGPKWTSGVVPVDVYGNPVTGATVLLAFSPAVGGSGSVASLDWSGWTTVTSNTSFTSVTDASGNTPSFTATGPKGSSSKPSTTVTASSSGKSVSCTVTS